MQEILLIQFCSRVAYPDDFLKLKFSFTRSFFFLNYLNRREFYIIIFTINSKKPESIILKLRLVMDFLVYAVKNVYFHCSSLIHRRTQSSYLEVSMFPR